MSRDPDTYAGERKAKEMQMLCGSLSAELVQMVQFFLLSFLLSSINILTVSNKLLYLIEA